MNKNAKKSVEIKSLCDKILNFKISEISDQKSTSQANKKSKNTSKNSLEEIKKTLTQINNLLKKESNLSKNQKDIFVFLSDKGLEKLTEMIKMDNEEISKLSFLCLINILYKNDILVNIYCEKYGFNPVGNVICINWLPKIFEEKISLTLELLQDIQDSAEHYKQNTKYWKWPNNDKYNDNNIPDPHKYLLGFVHKENENVLNDDNEKKQNNERILSKYEKEVIDILEGENNNDN
jgi:hypothetical protein